MTPSPQIRPQRYPEVRQESCSSDTSSAAYFDDNKMSSTSCRKQKGEDSSNSSDRLSGSVSGSGAGYSADCSSSSDSSFLSSKHNTATTAIQQRVGSFSLRQNQPDDYKAPNIAKTDASRESGAVSLNGKSREKDSDAKKEQLKSARESGRNSQIQCQHGESSTENVFSHAGTPDTMHGYAVFPQWNGVRISHPMDTRIDLSTVGYTLTNAPSGSAGDITGSASDVNYYGNHTQSLDHFLHLMDAVRPFYTGAKHNAQVLVASDGTNVGSSEGFTSFFTTTHNHTDSSASYSDTKLPDASSTQDDQAHQPADPNDHGAESDLSMMALARVKRKHQKRRHEESAEGSLSPGERIVGHGDQDSSSAHAHKQPAPQQDANQAPDEAYQNEAAAAAAVQIRRDNLSSSSKDSRPNRNMEVPRHQFAVPALPIVSESSDAFARGGFSSTSNPTNTSGSGSGGNSGVSNQSSAGSGNNTGSSGSGNEGKGENSGDGNSNSDENQASPGAKSKADVQADDKHALGSHQPHEPRHSSSPAFLNHQPADPAHTGDHDVGREKKIIDKKRKRMNMRREYEEQVKHDTESPENSDGNDEAVFEPAKPVALDFALSLSKSARLIVQATLPFLVVHTNAAYTGLTEVDSHEVNGRSLSSMLALPHPATRDAPQNNERQSHRAAAAAGRARAHDDSVGMNVERLVVANGFGQYHVVNVQAKPEVTNSGSCTIQCRMAVSPVVAHSPLDSSDLALVTDTNQDAAKQHHKRRKHNHDHTKPMERRHRTVITHYIIQLEKVDTTLQTPLTAGSEISQVLNNFESSNREMLIDNDEAFDETSQSTDAKEPVASIG